MAISDPKISAVVAMSENRVIGYRNQLPWRMPADLRHFKTITTGHIVVMGRKTYEAIGRALPNRTNIVVTRDTAFVAPGCEVVNDIKTALQAREGQNIFVIGGAEIYRQSLTFVQVIYLTIIHHDFEGDAYFPALNPTEWQEVDRETFPADTENPFPYSFIRLERVSAGYTEC